MTTNVTIETVDWPVEITQISDNGDNVSSDKVRVEPFSKYTTAMWDTRMLHLRELPREE